MKQKIKCIPCLSLPYPNTLKIVEMDAFELGYEGILKQNIDNKDKIIRYYSCLGKPTQQKYFTIKKEMLSIVNCILKFQDDLPNQKFLLCIDCKAVKYTLKKDVKNLVFEHIFVALLVIFDFGNKYVKGESNSLPIS